MLIKHLLNLVEFVTRGCNDRKDLVLIPHFEFATVDHSMQSLDQVLRCVDLVNDVEDWSPRGGAQTAQQARQELCAG